MQRRLLGCSPTLAMPTFLCFSRRRYYDKIRQKREGSDEGPAEMFHEFPKNSSPNNVPEELRNVSGEAIADAERMQRWFLFISAFFFLLIFSCGSMDPFGDGYRRPEGYGMPSAAEVQRFHEKSS